MNYIVPNNHPFIIPKGIKLKKKKESGHFIKAMRTLNDCMDKEKSTEDITVNRITIDEE